MGFDASLGILVVALAGVLAWPQSVFSTEATSTTGRKVDYRYQVCYDVRTLTAFAPRFSLILPTGDDLRGGGEATLGYQVHLPFSNGAQLVLGVAAPIGLNSALPDDGVCFYISFEHFFRRKQ